MKMHIVLYLVVGLVTVFASPVAQTIDKTVIENPDNKAIRGDTDNTTDSKATIQVVVDTELAKIESDQNIMTLKKPEDSIENNDGGEVEIVIEDNVPPREDGTTQIDFGDFEPFAGNRIRNYPKITDEIMETAEGFVPIRIFRKKQKPRHNFATRRYFKRYPYRRFPFYPYYTFYRPSSLRFY